MAHILIAEDDASLRSFLTTALTRAGHAATAHPDGLAAFDAMKTATTPLDLLLTDIVMPGLDGIELAIRAREIWPDLSVLYITGFGITPANDVGPGASGQVLAKPLHLGHLLAEINRILASKSPACI